MADTDDFTLDQLRTLLLVTEAGSFSAAARRLRRVQSAVSQSMSTLEERLGVALWDRSHKVPVLTERGRAVASAARRVCDEAAALSQAVASMRGGVEPSVRLVVDALFPLEALAALGRAFAAAFPTIDLRIDTEAMSAVSARVLSGEATLGVVSPMGNASGLVRHPLTSVRMIPVIAASHPLVASRAPLTAKALKSAVQIVLAERGGPGVDDQAVHSTRTWRVAELHTKHALLASGLGWGNLPEHLVKEELARGLLVRITPSPFGEDAHVLPLAAVHLPTAALGPAHLWVLAELGALCAAAVAPAPIRGARARPSRPSRSSGKRRSSDR